MTDLRDRLQELADAATRDGTTPGPAHAIRRGRQRRRRIVGGVASLLLVAVVAVAAGTGQLGDRPPGPVAPPGVPSTTVPPEVRADPVPDEVAAQLWEDTKSALRECGGREGRRADADRPGDRLRPRLGPRRPATAVRQRDVLGQRRIGTRRGLGGGSQRVGEVAQKEGRGQRQLRRQPRLGLWLCHQGGGPGPGGVQRRARTAGGHPRPGGTAVPGRLLHRVLPPAGLVGWLAGRPGARPGPGRTDHRQLPGHGHLRRELSRGRPGPRRRPRRRRWWRRRRSGRRRSGRAR